jgi:hypothetical protein
MGKEKAQRKRVNRHQPLYDDIRSEQIVTVKGIRHKKQAKKNLEQSKVFLID